MRYSILLLGLALLVAGCIGSAPAQNQTPPSQPAPPAAPAANNTTGTMSCNDYCVTLPHTQCEGSWKISGTYPDCVCTYECVQNQANATNATTAPEQPPAPLPPTTNESVSEMLTGYMNTLRTDFYKSHDGMFNEKSYTWQRLAAPSGGITFNQGPATDVLFDGKSADSIKASGFYVFTASSDGSQTTVGTAIFQSKTTMLDSYTGSDTFSVSYFPPSIAMNLTGCSVTGKDFEIDQQQNWYVAYFFSCAHAVPK